MKYQTAIFDYDGTIMDSQPGIVFGMKQALASFGIEESAEVIRGLIGPPLTKTILVRYGLTSERRDEIMAEFRRYQFEKGIYDCHIYEGVPEMLERLRAAGLRLAIATNKPGDQFRAQIEHFQLGRYFDAMESNNNDQTRGTKSDFVRFAMERCGGTPGATVMVGDRAGDIQGGLDNGVDTLGVLYGYGARPELAGCAPTGIVETPAQAAQWILSR